MHICDAPPPARVLCVCSALCVLVVPHLFHVGNGLDTPESLIYSVSHLNNKDAPAPKTLTSKSGDGTVNVRSLRACASVGLPGQTTTLELPNETHIGMLSAKPFLHKLAEILDVPGLESASALREHPRWENAGGIRDLPPEADHDSGAPVLERMHTAASRAVAKSVSARQRLVRETGVQLGCIFC
jgi:hypothetical protein